MGELRLEDIGAIIEGLVILAIGLFCLFALIALWPKISLFVRALWHRYVVFSWDELMERMADDVNDYATGAAVVMSRRENDALCLARPSLQTAPPQTPDQTETPAERRKKMLDICTILRRRGFSRDEARVFLNLCGMPLDNNVWAQVPPAPEPDYTTPIAGRPTAAQFEADPELTYNPPPR